MAKLYCGGGTDMDRRAESPVRRGGRAISPDLWALFVILSVGLLFRGAILAAQEPLSQAEIASHLMVYVAPSYPATAQTAKVQGKVVAMVEIGPEGLVRSAKAISGPVPLRQAAVAALKQWRYVPFHQGASSIAVTGQVLVDFTLVAGQAAVHTPHESTANGTYTTTITFPPPDNRGQPDEEIANRFDPAWAKCSRGVIAHARNSDQATNSDTMAACKEAAAVADEFPSDRRFVERREVYVYAATAYANTSDLQTALRYADKAVSVVKLGHDDSSGSEASYSVRGEIRAYSGDLSGGDQDLTMAESFCRNGQLTRELKRDLQFHAELLRRMNRLPEAQAKSDAAAKL